jgi:hypothetical protein
MAMPRDHYSSERILRDSGFHHAALLADAEAKHLAEPLAAERKKLKEARDATEAAEATSTEKLAVLLRTDFELDDLVRTVNLELLVAVGKNRQDPGYRAAFPNGLSALVGLRGEAQAREVKRLIGVLKEATPELAESRGAALDKLADESFAAEKAWRDSVTAGAQAFALERIARTELIEQMQKNEGALTVLYPGQRRRVRSFYRPAHRRGAAPETGEPEATAEADDD